MNSNIWYFWRITSDAKLFCTRQKGALTIYPVFTIHLYLHYLNGQNTKSQFGFFPSYFNSKMATQLN